MNTRFASSWSRGRPGRRSGGVVASALAALLGAVLVSGGAFAGDVPNQRYRDATYKFSLSYPDGWDQVPVETGDKDTVCRFIEHGADAKGVVAARLSVWRFGPSIDETAATPAPDDPDAAKDDDKPADDPMKVFNEMLRDDEWSGELRSADGKAVKSKDGVAGKVWELESKREKWTAFHVFAVFSRPDGRVRYALWERCAGAQAKKDGALFRKVVESFQWFDDKAKEVQTLDVLKDLPIPAAKKREIERGLVKGWNVIVSPKKNYVVVYDTMGKRNDELAKIISVRVEQIREQVYEVQFPPVRTVDAVSVVRVCGDRTAYRAYGGPGGTAGYWNPEAEELVFYDASPARKIDEDTLAVLFHEAFHQYIYYSTGQVAPHSWFDEGHGDYYAGARSAGGKFKIGPFAWRVGVVKAAIRAGPSPRKADGSFDRTKGGYTPLVDLVRFTQDEYYAYPSVSYAQGWSLVYFLREIVTKNPKMNEKWGKILATYFDTLKGTAKIGPPVTTPGDKPAPKPPDPATPPAPAKPPVPTKPAGDPDGAGMDGGAKPPAPESDPDGEPPADGSGIAPPRKRSGEGGGDLTKALEEAFKGIDWKEFEEAWKAAILLVPG